MALYTVANGDVFNATDLNQVVFDLQRATGTQEQGKYFIAGSGFTGGAVSTWVSFRSKVSSPVSVTIDTSTQAPTGNLNSPFTAFITSTGYQVVSTLNANNANGRAGGVYTTQY